MSYEVTSARTTYPYKDVVYLSVTYPDGSRFGGTGAIVGRNDVLTATHMLYDPDHGGWATKLDIYPGADVNMAAGGIIQDAPYKLGAYTWTVNAFPNYVFSVGSNSTLTYAESQYDVAIIGLSIPIGDIVGGWFGLATGYNTSQYANEIGYPSTGTGMMAGTTYVTRESQYSVYSATATNGGDLMGPGSSGGPLYIIGSDGKPYIIGVKSSGTAGVSDHWADIDLTYNQIESWMAADDSLLGPAVGTTLTGGAGNDTFTSGRGNDAIDGGAGINTVVYSTTRANYTITQTSAGLTVSSTIDGTDTLVNVQRLTFWDESVAFDINGDAGEAYRLYKAALNRTPDKAGLGYWIKQLDQGGTLANAANGFANSAEFKTLYGASASNADIVEQLYQNALHRPSDAAGKAYWVDQLNHGTSLGQVIAGFSESPENQLQVIGAIQNGIEYIA